MVQQFHVSLRSTCQRMVVSAELGTIMQVYFTIGMVVYLGAERLVIQNL